MRIFLFEFVTGGGFLELPSQPLPTGPLLTEAEAMWRGCFDDLSGLPDVEVLSLRDARLPKVSEQHVSAVSDHPRERILNLAIGCDFTLLIAPEFDQHLLRLALGLETFGVKLLSPNSGFIRVASDKTATCNKLAAAGVQVPAGVLLSQQLSKLNEVLGTFPYPAVLKHNFGAGSMCKVIAEPPQSLSDDVMRIEQMVNGIACSISFFCQAEGPPIACPPMHQILSCDGELTYQGGKRIMDVNQSARATRLGNSVVAAMPPTNGYVGIDLVLGDREDGRDDYAIEVNPRLTTSYIGLREIAEANLAEAMVKIASGQDVQIPFAESEVSFAADGTVS